MADASNAAAAAGHAAEAAHHRIGILPVVILLAAAVIAVPLFKRAGLGSVLGYLAAGLAVGPFGLGLFEDAGSIISVAELVVVMFLFVIGLEMQPSRPRSMRGDIFGLGAAQVVVCMLLLWTVGLALGYPVAASLSRARASCSPPPPSSCSFWRSAASSTSRRGGGSCRSCCWKIWPSCRCWR